MTSPGVGLMRGARAVLLAVALVALSALSHRWAGGADPGVVPLVALGVLTAVAVGPMARRRLSLVRLMGLLGAGQVVLHLVLDRCAELGPALSGIAVHATHAAHGRMLLAHVAVTVVVGIALRYGDDVLWRLWAWLARDRVPGAPRALVARASRSFPSTVHVPRRVVVRGAVQQRGPPALCVLR
ncbi:hypothetical protein [Oerskovia flava]|uniref:hypothetical protein n=1 Tax=Oerskovia flava TaxID=2986422 RepID=UPI00223E9DD4|nr:hypothetical protein [Oerskovia sp. JB1-3-2]